MKCGFVIAGLLVGACKLGMPVGKFTPASGPHGVTADLETIDSIRIAGELLAVQDSGLVVLQSDSARIAVVRYRSLRWGEFLQFGGLTFAGTHQNPARLDQLRRVSRYPQGLSPELLRQLLEAHNQRDPAVY